MTETAVLLLLFLAFAAFAFKRSLTYMHIYQQEEYDTKRFLKWMFSKRAFDKRLSIALLVPIALSFFSIPSLVLYFLTFIGFAIMVYREKDPRKDSKKNLVLTARTKRILFPALILSIAAGLWCFFAPHLLWIWLINIHLIPFMMLLSNEALQPYEKSVQAKFRQDAENKLMDYRPKIIAVTGSFGKTSVKHILGHVLKMHAPTLITPGSVNTLMGITRIIREELEPEHKFLILEMGAYGPGSIKSLCRFAPPDMGIITAIGHAHYERFKSLEIVAEAKYELADSVLRKDDGLMIVHENTLRFDHTQKMRSKYAHQFITCGESEEASLIIQKITQNKSGLDIEFSWKGNEHSLTAPLFGLHHGHNIALAFIAAAELGMSADDIQAALKSLPQIQHRLEVKPQANGTIIIDDAYNSNPTGFSAALDLLKTLGKTHRKILITPGMVELGQAHREAHEQIGRIAGSVCDVTLLVNGQRIPSFTDGFKKTGERKILHHFSTFIEAQKWINENQQDGDVILVENDLPDLYEASLKI